MAEPHTRYLHEQLTSAQGKYAYFLLAAAASAIALAVNQTAGEPLKRHQTFLGIAVLCWGLSFYFGCRYLGWMNATLRTNIILSMIQNGSFPGLPNHPQLLQQLEKEAREAGESHAEQGNRDGKRQFRFLIAGAVFYVLWHTVGMALRTPGIHLGWLS